MKIAVLQSEPQSGDGAFETLQSYAVQAAQAGCDVLVTPEMFLTGYNIGARAVAAAAEPENGPSIRKVADIARHNRIAVVVGHPVRTPGGKAYNSASLIDRHGKTISSYAKTHLYGDIDRAQFSPGDTLSPVVELAGWRVALAICYDIEFPELVRSASVAGADVVLCPTANMEPYQAVTTRLVPARAQENGVAVAYANYCGSEGQFTYCGLSCICGPDGEDLARAGSRDEALIMAELSLDDVRSARREVPYLADRRPQLYGAIGGDTKP